MIYVARQLGHDARLTLTRYGHVIDELDAQPHLEAQAAIRAAHVPSQFPGDMSKQIGGTGEDVDNPHSQAEFEGWS